jgi:prepilin peptidase CpaA
MPLAIVVIFPALMAISLSMDLLTMTIPNWISVALVLAYFAFAVLGGLPVHDILLNFACASTILSVAFFMYCLKWIGGGDAKLAAATALWMGWGLVLDYGVAAAIGGGVLSLILLSMRIVRLPTVLARCAWVARLHDKETGVPYGIALARMRLPFRRFGDQEPSSPCGL